MTILRTVWRFLVGVKDALVLLFMLLFFGLLWAALNARAPLSVPSGSALVLNLEGVIVDQAAEPSPLELFTATELTRETEAQDVIRAIQQAREDDRIRAIVLQLDTFLGAGQANLQAIGAELARFKATGKPVYAYATAYLDDGYLLAAQANEAWVNPLGGVYLTGPGGTGLYFAQALEQLGVEVNVFRVGTFKAAVEPFTRTEASPEAEAALQALVNTLWSTYRADVNRARPRVDVDAFLTNLPQRLAATQGDLAVAALRAGLVDEVGTYSMLGERVARLVGPAADDRPGGFNQIELNDYLAASGPLVAESGPAVGVVYVSGAIVDGDAAPGTAGAETIAELIEDALADEAIRALVVRIDSPGGSVLASERIRQALLIAKSRKIPVVASMGPVAASGGYWVATAADVIYAQPSTITGSIGVFAIIPTFQETLAELGIGADGVQSTPYSGAPDLAQGLTPETRAIFQASVENIYGRFINLVADARNMPPARVDAIAQGRVWAGVTARELGLVDRLGGLDVAITEARRRAELAEDGRVVDIEPKPLLPAELLNQLVGASPSEGGRDVVGKAARLAAMRFGSAASTALGVVRQPQVQALCDVCWNWSLLPAHGSGDLESLARAAVLRR